jgi:hypothetical protein
MRTHFHRHQIEFTSTEATRRSERVRATPDGVAELPQVKVVLATNADIDVLSVSDMAAPPICHKLEEVRLPRYARMGDSFLRSAQDFTEVIPVHCPVRHAMSLRITRDSGRGLTKRDVEVAREQVVLANEDRR